jgi:calcium-dependent protein kinase
MLIRDIKPENILYESTKPNSPLKVVDFGTSKMMDPNKRLT